jgi:hypothetical protein
MLMSDLLDAPVVHTGEWQALKTAASPAHATHELEDVSLVWERVPASGVDSLVPAVDKDWAAEHFRERVSGFPYNPAPSHVSWPYAVRGNADHTDDAARFDHTYPERFWPKYAGAPDGRGGDMKSNPNQGIRFHYGDLDDVVNLLVRSPLTRQAYLPVWFPEDTGAVDGQRVPCTLGYHFMQRGSRLSVRYYIRSCDAYRHLSNDIYLAAALLNWVCDEVTARNREESDLPMRFRPGGLVMHISSLHSFVGDNARMKQRIEEVSR